MNPDTESWHLEEDSPAFHLAEAAAFWALTKQGTDILILDLRGKSDVCDFFLICTGSPDIQVNAIAKAIQNGLVGSGHALLHAEGLGEARWALLDFVNVVVHVFQPETRGYYQLERLWGEVPRVSLDENYFTVPVIRQRHGDLPLLPSGAETSPDATGQDPC